jgi:hypothetical protein
MTCCVNLGLQWEVTRYREWATFLIRAVETENEAFMLFWCEQRELASPDELELIGSLEFALHTAMILENPCVRLLISKLAEQRCRLKELALTFLPRSLAMFQDDRLLDAQAYEVFDALVAQNVPINPCLRPCKGSIYNHITRFHYDPSIACAEALWEAGFRDVTAANYSEVVIAPLLFVSIHWKPTWCKFLVSRGAKWTEEYPGGGTTTGNVFGLAAGDYWIRSVLRYENEFTSQTEIFISELFNEQCIDGCCCGCSRSGCVFITAWIKGATESFSRLKPREGPKYHRTFTYTLALWAAPAARMSRWVASALIRSLTFYKLDIRHTCCNIQPVLDQTRVNRTESKPPTLSLRYSPEALQEILDEDAFLLSRLEQLVAVFDAQYDSRGEDIVNFIMGYWSETMLSVLEDLARTDREQYCEGRQHLGIYLEMEMDKGSNRSTLAAGLVGEVNLDTLIYPYSDWPEWRIRDVAPQAHALDGFDELDDIFHEAEQHSATLTPTS